MRERRLLRFHGLKRPRVRQTWNKYNLYNLSALRTPYLMPKTFFQQKWVAKSLTRGYHGEHIKENKWERMFSRRLLSVVNMNPWYMAKHNGSEQAAGRGSGLVGVKRPIMNPGNMRAPTPYMQMTFAPMERRLDIAIFRAMFASSARQARQFVVHGFVTVNGKKMTHPSYLLNPGDMFQVDIDRVMAATGKPKKAVQPLTHKLGRVRDYILGGSKSAQTQGEGEGEGEGGGEVEGASDVEKTSVGVAKGAAEVASEETRRRHVAALRLLQQQAKLLKTNMSLFRQARAKQRLRQFLVELKTALADATRSRDTSEAEMSQVEQELTSLLAGLSLKPDEVRAREQQSWAVAKARQSERNAAQEKLTEEQKKTAAASPQRAPRLPIEEFIKGGPEHPVPEKYSLSAYHRAALETLMREEVENPHDPSKPYATPWQPRDWMAPFAFIPRYLEVNQRICAAVYLRHPVARPGRSEVPTPFPPMLNQLAFNWYLKRR